MTTTGILGGLEHLAHRKIDNAVEKFIGNLSPPAQRFLSRNKTWLIGGLDILATITGIVRPNSSTWDIIQTSFSSFVEGLERATKDNGVDNISGLPAGVVQGHVDTFNRDVVHGLLSGDDKDCKNIARWIKGLQKNNPDLAKKAYLFVSRMTPRDISRFAGLSSEEKTTLLESALPKKAVLKEYEPSIVEVQRKGLDLLLGDLDESIAKAKKRLKNIRKKAVPVSDKDILSEECDNGVHEVDLDDIVDEESDETLSVKTSIPTDRPTGGWEW